MTQSIRVSPSGPFIVNSSGAQFTPGTGARLRLVEATTTIGTVNVIPTAANYAASAAIGVAIGSGNPLQVGLNSPSQNYNYRATALLDVTNSTTNVAGAVQLYLEASFDQGATWHEQASNAHLVIGTTNGGASRQMRVDMPSITGAGMGMPVGAVSLLMRARIGATVGGNVLTAAAGDTGDGASKGPVILQLEEMF